MALFFFGQFVFAGNQFWLIETTILGHEKGKAGTQTNCVKCREDDDFCSRYNKEALKA